MRRFRAAFSTFSTVEQTTLDEIRRIIIHLERQRLARMGILLAIVSAVRRVGRG